MEKVSEIEGLLSRENSLELQHQESVILTPVDEFIDTKEQVNLIFSKLFRFLFLDAI